MNSTNRREFLRTLGLVTAGSGLISGALASCSSKPTSQPSQTEMTTGTFFKISLAEWSFHTALEAREMDNLDFPVKARNDFGLSAVEYVNKFFKDKAKDSAYLAELKKRCDDHGVTSVLIMCDDEGSMADADSAKRQQTVENHYRWIDAAKYLGCHAIRVNCAGTGSPEEVAKAGADGLRKLCEFGQAAGINVIVENHGGNSSNGKWLSGVIRSVGLPNCGVLADFNNFCLNGNPDKTCKEWYDRYQGVSEMMQFAKGVSAKSIDFDAEGNCVETDYIKMFDIIKRAGYTGYVGVEYEGTKLSEPDGIKATIKLLHKVGA